MNVLEHINAFRFFRTGKAGKVSGMNFGSKYQNNVGKPKFVQSQVWLRSASPA